MTRCEFIEYLRSKASRCRELADAASAQDAATALRRMAADMETAADALENFEHSPEVIT